MATRTTSKPHTIPHVFILWNDHFDEATAETFINRLQAAAIPVTIIDIQRSITARLQHVTHRPIITLRDAIQLAKQAICVVLPCDFVRFSQVMRQPHLQEFLRRAEANNAQFVGHEEVIEQLSIVKIHDRAIDWVYDDEKNNLDQLAHLLTRELLQLIATA